MSTNQEMEQKSLVYTLLIPWKKGGVDIVNLLSAHNTQKIKSNCWAKNALIFILNTVYTNAKTIFSKSASKKSLSSLEFTNQSRKILIKKC